MWLLSNILWWTISEKNREIIEDLWVIDFHSHIWNILVRDEDQIYDENKRFPTDIRTVWWNFGKFKAPWKIMQTIMHTKIVDDILKESGKNRNSSATLKTFSESINKSFITKSIILPIPPHQTFEDLLMARDYDERMILFTWVDFTSLVNLSKEKYQIELKLLDNKFKEQIALWAKWLKIHPIIQGVSADSDIVDDVVDIWKKYDLPVIFHTWVTEYCNKKENCSAHKPEYGEIKYFINLAQKHRDLKIVIWHSWLFQVDEVINYLSRYENVTVDTSFQSKEKILWLLKSFWSDRLMFASDWPYWDRIPALNVMLETLNGDEDLIRKIMRDNSLESMNLK